MKAHISSVFNVLNVWEELVLRTENMQPYMQATPYMRRMLQ